jgi:glycosyltransferase involved in cell wall biosynthesis
VHPFVPVQNLASFFQAAEIGVWPTQESISMLDAAACGLPIIVNDTMAATERIDGNGLTYKLNDLDDLVRVLRGLRDAQIRRRLGECGARKMRQDFSWEIIAKRRLQDYQIALQTNGAMRAKHLDRIAMANEPLRSRQESVD